jgi:serine/threonine protein kinase
MSENWQRWEHEVVNGVFPLRRSVRNSGHSAVFLTEHKSKAIPEALLKLVPAIPTLKEAQLSQWSSASRLSHPCLVRLLDTGSCQLGGLSFLYVVTEYAEQTLAQILEPRVLEIEEFKKLMRPVLEGLSFLHRRQLVHGGLKPSNLLMFKERLKLASDAVRPAGESSASLAPASEFDPPESRDGSYSAAGDVWSLGVLIVEALTQKRPVWPDKMGGPVLPKSLPAALVGVVLRCLNRNPARRPTVEQLDAEINPMWPVYLASERSLLPAFAFASGPVVNDLPVVPEPPVIFPRSEVQVASAGRPEPAISVPVISGASPELAMPMPVASGTRLGAGAATSRASMSPGTSPATSPSVGTRAGTSVDTRAGTSPATSPGVGIPAAGPNSLTAANEPIVEPTVALKQPPKRGVFLVRAAMIVAGVLAAGWVGAVLLSRQAPTQAAAIPVVAAAVPAAPAPMQIEAPAPVQATEQSDPRLAVHEEIPDVPEKALATIHGRMLFAIRVTVDPEGRIVHAVPVGSRASKYFARLCTEAAMRWKFAPADTIAARKWLVHFEFTRGGVVAHVT